MKPLQAREVIRYALDCGILTQAGLVDRQSALVSPTVGIDAAEIQIAQELIHEAYRMFVIADEWWGNCIEKEFPNERRGDVRYLIKAKGQPGSALRLAHESFVKRGDQWRHLWNLSGD